MKTLVKVGLAGFTPDTQFLQLLVISTQAGFWAV